MLNAEQYKVGEDLALVERIKEGDKRALEILVQRHYGYIYNIALKFFNNVQDAEDATQEVTIKLITKIGHFDPAKGQLRTWLYRIVFNHYLNAKKSPHEIILVDGFNTFFGVIGQIPDQALSDEEEKEMKTLIDEVKVACMAGMLMCLNREQRLTFIIGELFDIDHNLAAEIFDITPANFRQRLSRARKELYNWMNNKCGLVNKANPCRCPKKTRGFVQKGFVNEKALKWNVDFSRRIYELSEQQADDMLAERDAIYRRLYKEHPYKDTENKSATIISEILANERFSKTFSLSEKN